MLSSISENRLAKVEKAREYILDTLTTHRLQGNKQANNKNIGIAVTPSRLKTSKKLLAVSYVLYRNDGIRVDGSGRHVIQVSFREDAKPVLNKINVIESSIYCPTQLIT